MKLIRRQRNAYALLFIISVCLTVWFGAAFMVKTAFIFGIISVASLLFLVRQIRMLYDATLIWDNRILEVSSAFILTEHGREKNNMEKTVVSTFGMLIGNKIYRWGRDGICGVRLNIVEIDKERMYLTFGDTVKSMRVELLHGITEQKEILYVAQKLWYETGVKASISGWEGVEGTFCLPPSSLYPAPWSPEDIKMSRG